MDKVRWDNGCGEVVRLEYAQAHTPAGSSYWFLVLRVIVTLLGIVHIVPALFLGLVEGCSRKSVQFGRLIRAIVLMVLCEDIAWGSRALFLYTRC